MGEPRLLILGAGVYQVPLISRACEMGYETVVLSTPGSWPGIALADVFLPVDITDPEAVVSAARDQGIHGVVTAGTDHGLPALGAVVDALGLTGPGSQSSMDSRDKGRMKAAFEGAGVPCAAGAAYTRYEEALAGANGLGFPVMVKPSASSGSRGVTVVKEAADFEAAWKAALAIGSSSVVVEEFLSGVEFGAQAVVHGDRLVEVVVHDDTVTQDGPPTPIGHAMPSGLDREQTNGTAEVVGMAVAALGLRDCIANVDLIMTDEGPRVIELAGRIGATGIPEVMGHHHDWDVYGHLLALALGDHPQIPAPAGRPNAVLLIRSSTSGTVKSLEVPADIANHPDLLDLQWDVGLGDAVRAFTVGPDRIGHLHVRGVDARTAERTAAGLHSELHAGLKIEVTP